MIHNNVLVRLFNRQGVKITEYYTDDPLPCVGDYLAYHAYGYHINAMVTKRTFGSGVVHLTLDCDTKPYTPSEDYYWDDDDE